VDRKRIAATYDVGLVEDGEAKAWYVAVPSIGRGRVIKALPGGALDRKSALEAVRDIVATSHDWEPGSIDVQLTRCSRRRPASSAGDRAIMRRHPGERTRHGLGCDRIDDGHLPGPPSRHV
jgi:hypothetical protein